MSPGEPDSDSFDPFDRGAFYGKPAPAQKPTPATSEDDDYELESPDEHILAAERRRAEVEIETARASVDIDEIYRETEADPDWSELWKGLRFQYQTKHLLILTAVMAVFFAIGVRIGWGTTIFVLGFLSLVAVHAYMAWRENQRQAKLEVRRKEMYERARMVREKAPATEFPPNKLN
jgi:magnesium-transporting ATPase (P-type)